jgi:hypothetical protein
MRPKRPGGNQRDMADRQGLPVTFNRRFVTKLKFPGRCFFLITRGAPRLLQFVCFEDEERFAKEFALGVTPYFV